jgi:hypothetical protein
MAGHLFYQYLKFNVSLSIVCYKSHQPGKPVTKI